MSGFFISYSHEDGDFVDGLRSRLAEAGLEGHDDSELRAGERWRIEIDQAIRQCQALILVMSPVARESRFVDYEWAFALGWGVKVIVLLLKLKIEDLHPALQALHLLDFTHREARPWEALITSLRKIAAARQTVTVAVPPGAPAPVRHAAAALDGLRSEERLAAIELLGQIRDDAAGEALAQAVHHPVADVRRMAAYELAKRGDPRGVGGLIEAWGNEYHHDDEIVEGWFARMRKDARTVPALVEALPGSGPILRGMAALALGQVGDASAIEPLMETLGVEGDFGRFRVLRAIGSLCGKDDAALRRLMECIEEMRKRAPDRARAVLSLLEGFQGTEAAARALKARRGFDDGLH
jgi:hypothetical protein